MKKDTADRLLRLGRKRPSQSVDRRVPLGVCPNSCVDPRVRILLDRASSNYTTGRLK